MYKVLCKYYCKCINSLYTYKLTRRVLWISITDKRGTKLLNTITIKWSTSLRNSQILNRVHERLFSNFTYADAFLSFFKFIHFYESYCIIWMLFFIVCSVSYCKNNSVDSLFNAVSTKTSLKGIKWSDWKFINR